MENENHMLTQREIERYVAYLQERECADSTVSKYKHDLHALLKWLGGESLTKTKIIDWKEHLVVVYAAASVNSMLAAANGFFQFMDWRELIVKPLKIQRTLFCDEDRELTKEEYVRLVKTARQDGNERLALILQTICSTGIRISELKFITAEAVRTGHAKANSKGKMRTVFLPERLCGLLRKYLQKEDRRTGPVFVTRTGRPLDRSNIWRDMKKLCENADIDPDKVFPHNLRHLFARTYYSLEKDLSRLADILGHTNITTTRIYTVESGKIHAHQVGRMGLVIT